MAELEIVLSHVAPLPFDEVAAKEASKVYTYLEKRGELIDLRDLFIGSIVRARELTIVTRNVEHFERIPDLKVISPLRFQSL